MNKKFPIAVIMLIVSPIAADERVERFDKDPGWEGINNRVPAPARRTVKQDFGYSKSKHAGSSVGEVGGYINPAAEPAWYGRKLDAKSFADPLSASGKLAVSGKEVHALIGFFNSNTLNEWRTPNTIAIRVHGRGDHFFAYVEYCTSKWRAGGDSPGGFTTAKDATSGRTTLRGFKVGASLEWSLKYDPNGNKGNGSIAVTLGTESALCHLDAEHKADGATFNHFGILNIMKSADGGGELWLDDLTVDGHRDDFATDPKWDGSGNRREYQTADVRPRFDFGYCATKFAGGESAGELGGLVFRGDCRYKDRLAAYGDRLEPLTLDKPLKASGKVALRRGVSDSTTLLGFYHSADSLAVNASQSSGFPKSFVGVAIEGPSRDGFLFYPAYRNRGDGQGYANGPRPTILPDGKPHDWALAFDPTATSGRGRLTVTFDGSTVNLDLGAGHRTADTKLDRFGLITTWIDGNGQRIYFDDLSYTFKQ